MIFENINYVMSNGIGRHELTHTGWLSQNWTNFFCIHLTSLSRFDLATLYTNFILHGSSKIIWNCIKYLWNGCICWNIIQLKCITNKYDLSVIITYTLQKSVQMTLYFTSWTTLMYHSIGKTLARLLLKKRISEVK